MPESPPSTEHHPFNADQPIAAAADDLLGRAPFARAIAETVSTWRGRETLVLAVYGSWGAGKSSVKNMVLEHLAGSSGGPLVVEFSPWQWAGQQQLASGFFDEIEIALGKADPSKKGKALAKRWALYAARLKVGTLVAKGLRGVLASLLVIAGAVAVAAGSNADWLTRPAQVLGVLLFLFGLALAFSERLTAAVAEMFNAKAAHLDRTLDDVRTELKSDLAAMPRSVLVVIDDIDRLTADETRLLMQLVKANADFPSLIYLLLMDRGVVEKALTSEGVRGRDYIEKIVQVAFDLPVLDPARVQKVLFSDLNRVLEHPGVDVRFDQGHWQNVYFGGLRRYFVSLRDVRRFSGALSFDLSLVLNGDVLEVNPVDLIAIVALRMFEPDLYRALPSMKALLTGLSSASSITGPQDDDVKAGVEDLIGLASEARRDDVKVLMQTLFPQVAWVFDGHRLGGGFEENWYKGLRVCHEKVFDRYFQLALPEGDLSQLDIDQVSALSGDVTALTSHLRQLNSRGLLEVLFDRLEAYKTTLPLAHAEEIVTAIMNVGDRLSDSSSGRFGIDPSMQACRVVHWFVAQEPDETRRVAILASAVEATEGLALPVRVVSLESGSADKRKENPDFYLVDVAGEKKLQGIVVGKIETAAASGSLADSSHLASILFRWRDWAGLDPAQKWAMAQAATPEGFLGLIRGFAGEVHTSAMGSYASHTHRVIRLNEIETFVDEAALRSGLENLGDRSLTADESVAVEALRKALGRRDAGKPEEDFFD